MANSFRSKRTIESGKPTRFYSTIQEKEIAKTIDGKRQPNSGATMFMPGDIVIDGLFQLECKTCEKVQKSFSIKKEWIDKNRDESLLTGADYTALIFNFGPNTENFAVIDMNLFNTLVEYLKSENNND